MEENVKQDTTYEYNSYQYTANDIFNAIFQIQRGRYITKKAFDVDLTKLDKNKYKLGEYNSLFFVAVPESGNKKNLSQRIRVCTFRYK